jgi:hypothetical protein
MQVGPLFLSKKFRLRFPQRTHFDTRRDIVSFMADPHKLDLIRQGVEAWNQWRLKNDAVRPDLREANLREANLNGTDLSWADLCMARSASEQVIIGSRSDLITSAESRRNRECGMIASGRLAWRDRCSKKGSRSLQAGPDDSRLYWMRRSTAVKCVICA